MNAPSPTINNTATILQIAVKEEEPDDKWVRKKPSEIPQTESINIEDLVEGDEEKTDQTTGTGRPYAEISIEGIQAKFLIDNGAEISVISDRMLG